MTDVTFGTFFELGGQGAMEALGNAGLDYVVIDTEHGCFSDESTAVYIVAAENCGLAPFVRVKSVHRAHVLRMADLGARGLIVPNIRSVEQVHQLVDAAKFPPIGRRGFCPNRTTGWGAQEWATDMEEYMAQSNERLKVLPQCETREALKHIDEIAAVDGVDGIYVGSFDLSLDLGIPLQLDHPQLEEAIERILEACKKHNKEAYIFASTMEHAVKWAQRGFDSITYSLDATTLIGAYQNLMKDFRERV